MSPVGVTVEAVETPASAIPTYNTQNAFVPVLADWGPAGQALPASGLASTAAQLGTPSGSASVYGGRTTTSAVAIDTADTIGNEDGSANPIIYYSRVLGPTPVKATIALAPSAALTLTAQYYGAGGNGIYAGVVNNSTTYNLTLYDASGNILAASPPLSSLAAGVTWCATTNLVTAVSSGSTLPSTASATALSGGTDNRSSLTLANVTTALSAFTPTLGPGQLFAPNWTNTGLSGIWSALGAHCQANNRVAICDMDDDQTTTTLISDLGSFGTSSVASYCGFWAGNRQIPGIVPGTNRYVPPSPVIAALCARADQAGNPNLAAAGINYALNYATQPESQVSGAPYDTYSNADLQALAASSINTFQRINGIPTNYGFRSVVPPTVDGVYWQFSHARLRMYTIAQAQLIGQPFVFAQLDGQGSKQNQFKNALDGLLMNPLWKAGALYGDTAAEAYTIDVGSDVNTPATISAGQLNAAITTQFSDYAENVNIVVNVQPITSTATVA